MNWQAFFSMGGYGFYVWLSYGLMAFVFIMNVVLPLRRKTELKHGIKAFIHREYLKSNPANQASPHGETS